MLYRLSLILNSILSSLIIFLSSFVLLTKGDNPNPPAEIGVGIMLGCCLSIWFNFICFRIDKMNKEQASISKWLKLPGKILFVLTSFFALIIFLAAFFAVIQSLALDNVQKSPSLGSMIIVVIILVLLGITTISNLVFFSKSLSRNKILVSDFINDIGANKLKQ